MIGNKSQEFIVVFLFRFLFVVFVWLLVSHAIGCSRHNVIKVR